MEGEGGIDRSIRVGGPGVGRRRGRVPREGPAGRGREVVEDAAVEEPVVAGATAAVRGERHRHRRRRRRRDLLGVLITKFVDLFGASRRGPEIRKAGRAVADRWARVRFGFSVWLVDGEFVFACFFFFLFLFHVAAGEEDRRSR